MLLPAGITDDLAQAQDASEYGTRNDPAAAQQPGSDHEEHAERGGKGPSRVIRAISPSAIMTALANSPRARIAVMAVRTVSLRPFMVYLRWNLW